MHSVNGDNNRADFLNEHNGHRVHHLYLWYVADKMGVLSNVLNILSAEAGADNDNVHTDTQKVQIQRKRKHEGEEKQEREQRRAFWESVGSSLAYLAIASKQDNMRKEEDKIERLQLALFEAEDDGDSKKIKYYERLLDFGKQRVDAYLEELKEMNMRTFGDNKD